MKMTTITANAVCRCPKCGRLVREQSRLAYPREAVAQFAAVYRCPCGCHIGAPVKGKGC